MSRERGHNPHNTPLRASESFNGAGVDVTAPSVAPVTQRPGRAIALIIAATFLIVVMNAFAKLATDYHTPIEVVFYRGVVAMLLLLGYAATLKRFDIYKTARLKSHVGRGLAGNLGVVMVFWAYSLMPLADITALLFAAPLVVTLMAALFLKEKVGPYRWSAVLVGFLGVILIAQPAGGSWLSLGILVALGATFANALVVIFLRELGKTEEALTTVFYFLLFGVLFTAPYMMIVGSLPVQEALWPLLGTGVAGGLQLLIKTQAYRYAEASLLSPFTYSAIVWAMLLGWLFWGDLPTLPIIAGAAIIIAANLFIIWREKRAAGRGT